MRSLCSCERGLFSDIEGMVTTSRSSTCNGRARASLCVGEAYTCFEDETSCRPGDRPVDCLQRLRSWWLNELYRIGVKIIGIIVPQIPLDGKQP